MGSAIIDDPAATMKVPQTSGTIPKLRRSGIGLELGAEQELGNGHLRMMEELETLDAQDQDDPQRGQDGDDRAEDQADGHGRLPEGQEPRMTRPEVITGDHGRRTMTRQRW